MEKNLSLTELENIFIEIKKIIVSNYARLYTLTGARLYYKIKSDFRFRIKTYGDYKSVTLDELILAETEINDVGFRELSIEAKRNLVLNIVNECERLKRRQNEVSKKIDKIIFGEALPKAIIQVKKDIKKENLKSFVLAEAEKMSLQKNTTVPSKKLLQILKKAKEKGLTSSNTIETPRKILTREDYSDPYKAKKG